MSRIDETYHDLLNKIIKKGFKYEDPNRKDIYRYQIPNYQIEHDLQHSFPAITTKKLYWKGVVGELLWILRGSDNIKYLVDNGINIWNKDAYNWYLKKCILNNVKPLSLDRFIDGIKNIRVFNNHFIPNKCNYKLGDLGRIYGAQLRNWHHKKPHSTMDGVYHTRSIDQFSELIHTLKTNPMATKKTVTFWNPAEKAQCALTPCHWSFEILVKPLGFDKRVKIGNKLNVWKFGQIISPLHCDKKNIPKYQFTLKWHQHSVDTFLGR